MRVPRGLRHGQDTNYHCTSRTVGGQFLFTDLERAFFRELLWSLARFCQVQIGTYTCLSNHFHVVLRVPGRIKLSDEQLLKALERYYGSQHAKPLAFAKALQEPNSSLLERLRSGYLARMGNLSVFFKELKERFSKWYNALHQRFGTLWAERFRSLLVSDQLDWLLNVMRYVDLNPVRAGLVDLPEEYAFCGFGEAMAGEGPARDALERILPGPSWEEKAAAYQLQLYARGACPTKAGQAVLDPRRAYELYKSGQQLTLAQALLLKVPSLTEGIAVGGPEFLEEIAQLRKTKRRPKQGSVGSPMLGADWGGMMSLKKIKIPFKLPSRQ